MSMAAEETIDWSQLPNTALDIIMDCLNTTDYSIADYIAFGSVCVSWRSAYKLHNPGLLPLLMVPHSFSTLLNHYNRSSDHDDYIPTPKKKRKKDLKFRRFYNISNEKVDDRLKFRMPQNRHCRGGSSHGCWLITIDGNKSFSRTECSKRNKSCFSIRLFNPFLSSSSSTTTTGEVAHDHYGNILLPPLIERSYFSVYSDLWKAVLSADPISNPTDYMVMAIYSRHRELAFYKPGDKSWTTIKSPSIKKNNSDENFRGGSFEDLIYYQGKFFVQHSYGTVVVCDDVAGGGMTARVLLRPPRNTNPSALKYIVESSQGNLLQVHRYLSGDPSNKSHSTIGFKVFKLLLLHDHNNSSANNKKKKVHQIGEEDQYKWVRMKSLRGDAMFLGHNASFSISTINHPRCKSNCIYYKDNFDTCVRSKYGSHDMGVFNLVKGTFNRYFPDTSSILILPNPIWIQPPSLPRKKSPRLPRKKAPNI